MSLNIPAVDPAAPSGSEAIQAAGDIRIQGPNPAADRYLRRADAAFPFTPNLFLDELVQLFAMDRSGQPLSVSQFRAMAAEVKNSVVAAFLNLFVDAKATPPRAQGESDVAYLLHAWRHQAWHDEGAISDAELLPKRDPLAALAEVEAPDFRRAEAAGPDAAQQTDTDEPEPRASSGKGATLMAFAAMVLALASIAVSAVVAVNQNHFNQAMALAVRQQQDRLLQQTRANAQAIQELTQAIRAEAAARAAPAVVEPAQAESKRSELPAVAAPPPATVPRRGVPLSPTDPLMRLQPGQPFDLQSGQFSGEDPKAAEKSAQ